MGKLVFLCVVAAAGYFGYNHFIKQHLGPSEASMIYTRFADAIARDRFDEAKSLATGQALSTVEQEERRLTKNLSPINPYAGVSDAANEARKEAGLMPLKDKSVVTGSQLINEIAGTISSTKFEVATEHMSGDSSTLEVKGNICRQQSGCMGIRCGHCIQSLHTVKMCKDAGSWQVCAYTIAEVPRKE